MAKRTLGTTETVNEELAAECEMAWTFQSDLAFMTETATLLTSAVGPMAQVKNLRALRDDAKVRAWYLEALADEMGIARELGEEELLPCPARRKELMRAAREKLWVEKAQPVVGCVSPTILEQLGDGE